jgi:type IV pilus assembly protein PilQ
MRRFARWTSAALVLAAAVVQPVPAAPADGGQVVGVSLRPTPGKAELVIGIRGSVTVKDFVLSDPTRLVLDLQGATLATPAEPVYDGVSRAGVLNVRVKQNAPGVVRVVLVLDRERAYSLQREEDAIRVSFGADDTFLAWSSGMPVPPRVSAQTPDATATQKAAPAPAPVAAVTEVTDEKALPVRLAPVRLAQQRQEPRITVSWDNADIRDVVSGFAALSGHTIILGKGVTGQVTAEIRDKPWSQAFQAILAAQGLSAQEMPGGIIRVDAPSALAELDSLEPLGTEVVRVNYARAGELGKSVEGILTKNRGSVAADTASNSLIITDTRSRLAAVVDFAKGLDIRTMQVSIQAKIIFVDRTDLEALGLRYDLGSSTQFFNKLVQRQDPNAEAGETFPPNVNVVDLGGNAVSAIANAQQEIANSALDLVFSTAIGGYSLTAFLVALERIELSDIQAEPVISTLDNKKADILVGEEVPVRIVDYSTAGGAAGSQPRATVQFKETGIRLTVTPHVTNNRQILMNLRTERSSVKPLAAADLGFSIDKQATENQLLVNDGETAVIGGLTVTTVQRTRSGIPLLSSLPLVGNLFSFNSNSENRKDLLILVTPRIVDDASGSN